jgi:hypothetical protein
MVRDTGIEPVERLQPAVDERPRAIHVPLDLVRIAEYRPAVPLSLLFDKPVSCNTDLVTLEYSTTRVERHPHKMPTISLWLQGHWPRSSSRAVAVLYRWSDVVEWLDRNTIQRTDDPRQR